ncbi:MAG: bifunctional phosphopantothenoylcysteine decarboxylase/phosphopantothenate--cysteine ligase CoaBC, partial [Actinomycetota bacterium]|nr:bifunctional phosphopantothenoylcysteine decarboxylase/phosphopantothenate--cysteine ligase CoaBC [Actinomycetota bacterium]
ANDLLTNVLLTARCPVVMAPAMHTEMWTHPATQRNVAELRSRGVIVLEPASGRLTGTDTGPGRLPDPSAIVSAVQDVLRRTPSNDLAGLKILISAGGTQEAWDPVRFIGKRSSGRQGVELARTAVSRGAHVTLVAAHMDVEPPAGVSVVRVESAEDLYQAMHAQSADVIVMAAAVADFKPDLATARKIKKESLTGDLHLTLTTTVDVLASLVQQRTGGKPLIIGFAAETAESPAHLLELGRSKLARKGCDLLVVNEVGSEVVFGSTENKVTILGADGYCQSFDRSSKAVVADALWDLVATQL